MTITLTLNLPDDFVKQVKDAQAKHEQHDPEYENIFAVLWLIQDWIDEGQDVATGIYDAIFAN